MIKAIVADVDGVIVGKRPGVNFPLPHTEVIQKMHELQAAGLPIILCTARFGLAVKEIANLAGLGNPHITDGGALVIDLIDHKIIKKYVIDKATIKRCVTRCLEQGVYLELYTPEAYYLQRSQLSEFLSKRIDVLGIDPIIVDSLAAVAEQQAIIKMIVFTHKDDKTKAEAIVKGLGDAISFIWSQNLYLEPMRPGILTAPGVSKAHASAEALESLGISFDETLGLGDTASDWNFMEHCKYVATLANGDNEIKQLVKTKGEGNYFIAPSVDDNGFLEIAAHFL